MLRLPTDLLERPPEEAARLLALGFLREATDARGRLADPQDTEALHDFRVAVRRLRSCIRAFRPFLKDSLSKKLRNRLRDLTVATNAARDAEVLLALVLSESPVAAEGSRNGTDWLVQRLEARRVQALDRLKTDAIEPFDTMEPKLRRRLGRFETIVHLDRRTRRSGFGRVAGKLVRTQAGDLREQLAAITGAHQPEVAHRARITAKRLRYLVEPLARRGKRAKALVDGLKELQDVLGEIHDAQVLEDEVTVAGSNSTPPAAPPTQGEAAAPGSTAPSPETVIPTSATPDLSAVATLAENRLQTLFQKLKNEWLEGRAEPLFERIERFGAALENRRARNVEIERKYLLTGVPQIAREVMPLEIDQGWIAGQLVDERVRRTRTPDATDIYSRTIKLGSGVARSEFEESMSPDVFETMWPLTVNRRISKRRYRVPDGEITWEIDEFIDRELVLAEVELDGEEEQPRLPDWLKPYVVREVTGEPEYVNVNLAK